MLQPDLGPSKWISEPGPPSTGSEGSGVSGRRDLTHQLYLDPPLCENNVVWWNYNLYCRLNEELLFEKKLSFALRPVRASILASSLGKMILENRLKLRLFKI